jgi:hypothetical protein
MTNKYDDNNNKTEETYFGADDKPIAPSNNCARLTYEYDAFDTEVEICCYDVSGGLLRCE